jgi:hypothetical protein
LRSSLKGSRILRTIHIGFESTPMKALACVAGLLALLVATLLGLLAAAGQSPDDVRVMDQWAQVDSLQLPEATLAEIREAFGPGISDGAGSYRWYAFNDSCARPWSMLWIVVDPKTSETIAYERQRPWIHQDGTVEKVTFDAGWRDEQGHWHSGPMPERIGWP